MGKRYLARLCAAAVCAGLLTTGAAAMELVAVGEAVGIELATRGMLVASLSKVAGPEGECAPAAEAGIAAGDIIVRLGGREVKCTEDFVAASERLTGETVAVTVKRGEKLIQYSVRPALTADGSYKLGLWLRSGAAGIGTVTFYDPATGLYGALGHSVNDADTGVTLPVAKGGISEASVTGVVKGCESAPGELQGAVDAKRVLGDIRQNTDHGIFGTAERPFAGDTVETAENKDIVSGPAKIIATVDGEGRREYDVTIQLVSRGGEEKLTVTVTDEELLEKTGGIVQGMSGCPILQNGKLVGAVTHVLLADPTRGYGITIGSMLSAAETAKEDAA